MNSTLEKNHVIPEKGDMLCIRHSQYGWGFSGDRFQSMDGDLVTSYQQSGGCSAALRTVTLDKIHYRVLRGTRLFHIA